MSKGQDPRWTARAWRLERTKRLAGYGGACEMCGEREAQPHLDHNHRTGKARGLLCAECNLGLGFLEKPRFLVRALRYLRRRDGLPVTWLKELRELAEAKEPDVLIEFWA